MGSQSKETSSDGIPVEYFQITIVGSLGGRGFLCSVLKVSLFRLTLVLARE